MRLTKLKVLQRISQCRSPTKPLEKELAQTLKHCQQRFNKLQCTHRVVLHALHKSRIRCKQLLSRKIKLTPGRDAWRSRATTSAAEARRLRRQANRVTLYKGGRLKASIRYMYYRMFQEGASENGANNTILAVAEGLGVKLPTCLPARRTKHKLRLEAGVWATFCAIRKMCAAKQDATRRGLPFSISKGRDRTTKQGWHFQVLTLTFRVRFDDPVSVVMAISLAHDKKAVTQATLTGTVVHNIVALSGGVLHEDDFKSSVVTDSANNEKKTNRLEGNKVHVPCLAHISSNTGKQGVKDQHVSCLCGQWDPPGGVGQTDSVQCESGLVWVQMSCYSLTHDSLPPSCQCVVCQLDSVPCVGATENWEYHEGKLRELVKAFFNTCQHLQGSCGSVLCYNLKVWGVSVAQCDYAWPQLPSYGFLGPPVGCCGYVWQITEFLSSRVFSRYRDHIPPEPGSEVCTAIDRLLSVGLCHSPGPCWAAGCW